MGHTRKSSQTVVCLLPSAADIMCDQLRALAVWTDPSDKLLEFCSATKARSSWVRWRERGPSFICVCCLATAPNTTRFGPCPQSCWDPAASADAHYLISTETSCSI